VPREIGFQQPGWVEQDPVTIWEAAETIIESCLSQVSTEKLVAIGISNQHETIMAGLGTGILVEPRRPFGFAQEVRTLRTEMPQSQRAELNEGWQAAVARVRR
jgi:sugar (pentulose or hexulose) kinase